MSDNTQDSGSFRRTIAGRQAKSATDARASIKNSLSRLSDSISRGVARSVESMKDMSPGLQGRVASKDAPLYSKGVRELNDQGYEVYNIGDDSEIFISRTPDSALFDDGDLILMNADDVFIGKVETPELMEVEEEETPSQEEAMSFFSNVPRGSTEVEIRGTVGVNNGGSIEPVAVPAGDEAPVNVRQEPLVSFEAVEPEPVEEPVQAVPAEQPRAEPSKVPDFMNRIRSGARPAPKAPVEEPVQEIPVEEAAPIEAPVEEPVQEIPVEEPVKVCEEFFDDVEESAEVPAEEAEAEDDGYDWMFEDEEPVQAPVESAAIPLEEATEAPVEESVTDDVDVDAVVAQVVAEEVAKQVAVAEALSVMVAKPSMPVSDIVIEDLAVTEESSVVDAAPVSAPASVETSAAAEAPRATGFDADGEALPPMADPVVKRPRSMRFRFSNGVLVNVDKEPKEELQGPLD